MKTDLGHLPGRKQDEIRYLIKVLFEEFEAAAAQIKPRAGKTAGGRILKIILFGSYARGTWVEDRVSGYFSDYDILVVVDKDYLTDALGFWLKAEDRLLHDPNFKTPVNIITHTLGEVNDHLGRGQYFFSDIVKEGVALYEYPNGKRFRNPAPLSQAEAYTIAKDFYELWMPGAKRWLRKYEMAREEEAETGDVKWLNDAAFELHQAAESLYHCMLLVVTNYTPHTHNLNTLRSWTERMDERLRTIWPQNNRLEKRSYELLRQAYVKARYSKHYRITCEELDWLHERIELLRDTVQVICDERLASLTAEVG